MTDTSSAMPEHYIAVPEAVGVFDDVQTLQAAIYDLHIAGFSRFDISLLASEEAVEAKLGKSWWRSEELADDPNAPRSAFVSEEWIGELEGYIAGGFFFIGSYIALAAMTGPLMTLAASIAAVAIGGGPAGILGVLLARRVGERHREYYENQVRHGGLLLWVRCHDKAREEVATGIMEGHSGRDVHVHGWSEA